MKTELESGGRFERMALLNEGNLSVEAQRKVDGMIQRDRIQENMKYAFEHTPEGGLDTT